LICLVYRILFEVLVITNTLLFSKTERECLSATKTINISKIQFQNQWEVVYIEAKIMVMQKEEHLIEQDMAIYGVEMASCASVVSILLLGSLIIFCGNLTCK